jgi:predicted nucleotidyltransferase
MERLATTLFGKTRRQLLARLFLEPQRGFRLRELARLTGISSGSVQHELRQLVGADIALRENQGGMVTYRANTRSPIFDALRVIVERTSGIEDVVREALRPAGAKIRLAFIYGSIAKGANRSRSDLDLLVVGSIGFAELLRLLDPAEERIGREISPRLYSPKEFRQRIKRSDRFLSDVMKGPKIVVQGEPDVAP